jgi:hypothetical protein
LLTKPSDNHESLNPITAHIESYRRGSGPIYDPLRRVLDETPREQPWSSLACFAKGAEKDAPGKSAVFDQADPIQVQLPLTGQLMLSRSELPGKERKEVPNVR